MALILLAMFGYGVDIQTGVPRVWTGIATVAFALGSIFLFDGVSASWITLLVAFVGITLAMVAGMPTMVRSRFSTPTIGRDWMIGEMGVARTDIAPDGVVTLRDAPWRARTNRATPIRKLALVRVVAIEGLVLEVEPEEGGARDYREPAPARGVRFGAGRAVGGPAFGSTGRVGSYECRRSSPDRHDPADLVSVGVRDYSTPTTFRCFRPGSGCMVRL